MTKAANILLITPGFPADEADGNCIPPLQVFLHHLRQAHPEIGIGILSLHYPHARQTYTWHGIPVEAMGGKNVRFPAKWLMLSRAKRTLKQWHAGKPFTAVHVLWWGDGVLSGCWFARRFQVPLLVTLMGQDALPGNAYLKWARPGNASIIALSGFHADAYRETTGREVTGVIPWGIDPQAFGAGTPVRPVHLLGAGSLVPLKQYELFIDAAGQLAGAIPDFRAILAGGGPEYARLKEMLEARNLAGQVELTGELPREELVKLMHHARVFLHPSRYESQGYACLEALAAGCRVVSMRTGIAQAGSHWHIAESEGNLAEQALAALKAFETSGSVPQIPYPVSETVSAYARLYLP